MALDKSDFKDWLENPVTKEILSYMRGRLAEYSEKISVDVDFMCPTYNHFQSILAVAYLKGAMAVYKHITDLDFDEFELLNPKEKEASDEISAS